MRHPRIRKHEVTMQKAIAADRRRGAGGGAPHGADAGTRSPRPRTTMAPTGDSARFAAIRDRFRRELATERAALERTHDRMREELMAAGVAPTNARGRDASENGRLSQPAA